MLPAVIGSVAIACAVGTVVQAIYNVLFHPLSHIPGPKLYAISRLPYIYHLLRGTVVRELTRLHEEYGDVVRFSPNEVSFSSGDTAWPNIYGARNGAVVPHSTFAKDKAWFPRPVNGTPSILVADDHEHARGRKILAHAFTTRALKDQEGILHNYTDQMVEGVRDVAIRQNQSVDLVRWFNWTTFDIISDLLFGESFQCLQNRETHTYVELLLDSLRSYRVHYLAVYFPWSKAISRLLFDQKVIKSRAEFGVWVAERCMARYDTDRQRADIMSYVLQQNGPKNGITFDEVVSNAQLMLSAGSETSATLLSGVIYLLQQNQDAYSRLAAEIRDTQRDYTGITLDSLRPLPYLNAVIAEALRLFPPVPTGFQRRVPPGGAVISGWHVPEHTALCVSSYPANRSGKNFKDPSLFIPERWMGDARFEHDKRGACQPFSYGPRACLGKNLAHNEVSLILAKLVWSFDLELDAASRDWMEECRVMMTWVKPPLWIRVQEASNGR